MFLQAVDCQDVDCQNDRPSQDGTRNHYDKRFCHCHPPRNVSGRHIAGKCVLGVSVGARNPPGFVSAQEFRRGLSAGFTLEIDVSELLVAVVAYHKQACACNSSTDQGGGKRRGVIYIVCFPAPDMSRSCCVELPTLVDSH
jgi:hypothetical protein